MTFTVRLLLIIRIKLEPLQRMPKMIWFYYCLYNHMGVLLFTLCRVDLCQHISIIFRSIFLRGLPCKTFCIVGLNLWIREVSIDQNAIELTESGRKHHCSICYCLTLPIDFIWRYQEYIIYYNFITGCQMALLRLIKYDLKFLSAYCFFHLFAWFLPYILAYENHLNF